MKRLVKFVPIILMEIYLTGTVILFSIGPFEYPLTHPIKLYSLLLIYQISLFIGYFLSIEFYKRRNVPEKSNELFISIIKIFLIFNVFFILFLMTREFGLSKFSIIDIMERIILGIKSPGEAYNLKFLVTKENIFGGFIGSIIIFVLQPILYLTVPFALVLFRKLDFRYKLLTIINIFLHIFHAIGIGTNKGIFDMVVFIIIICFLNVLKYLNIAKFNRKYFFSFGIALIFLVSFIFIVFNNNIGSRGIGDSLNNNEIHSIGLNTVPYNTDCLIFDITPSILHKPIALVSSYLTQGYYGLDIVMNEKVIPMFGLGNSMFLQQYISKYIFDISQLSLQYRSIPYNWDPYVNWHSLYGWFANDFGFLGVNVILIFFGYLFGNSYLRALHENIFSKIIFMLLFIMFLFIPMNSQIFSFMPTFIAFFTVSLLYLFFDK